MLRRIYVDNFRCLVNFELSLESILVFLGTNGAGKSAVFDAICKLQSFLTQGNKVLSLFGGQDLTKWDGRNLQMFELDIEGNGGVYEYRLDLDHNVRKRLARVKTESLTFNDRPLFLSQDGTVRLFRDDHSEGPIYPFDWTQSGVASILPGNDNRLLTWFKERMDRFLIVRLAPHAMSAHSESEEHRPKITMEDYPSWLRWLSQENQGRVIELTQELRQTLEGFDSFRLKKAGEEVRSLKVLFHTQDSNSEMMEYSFDQLSDGQRCLIALYTILHCAVGDGSTVCIDEPENFLALPEIQPWLMTLYDRCREGKGQALLISHHPELIDYLASDAGIWFSRTYEGPARVCKITQDDSPGLKISELIARGWINES